MENDFTETEKELITQSVQNEISQLIRDIEAEELLQETEDFYNETLLSLRRERIEKRQRKKIEILRKKEKILSRMFARSKGKEEGRRGKLVRKRREEEEEGDVSLLTKDTRREKGVNKTSSNTHQRSKIIPVISGQIKHSQKSMHKMSRSFDNKTRPRNKRNKRIIDINAPLTKGEEFCVELYEVDRKRKMEKEERRRKELNSQRALVLKEATFRPKISKNSLILTQELYDSGEKIEDRLLREGEIVERKKYLIKINNELTKKMQQDSYSYRPKINNNYIVVNNNFYVKNQKLKERTEKKNKEEFDKIYTFNPSISIKSSLMSDEKYKEIMQKFYLRKLRKEKEINDYCDNNVFTYKPKVGRGPKNPNQREITINLESDYDKRLIKDNEALHNNEMFNLLEKKQLWLNHTTKIILKAKSQKYKEIFTKIGGDKSAVLTYKNLNLDKVDEKTREILAPVVEELERNPSKGMGFGQFYKMVDKNLSGVMFGEDE